MSELKVIGQTTSSVALHTALAYFRAWTQKDLDNALAFVDEDVIVDARPGRLQGAAALRKFISDFCRVLVDSQLIAAFGDDTTAVMIYETETLPVRSAPGAECFTVRDGKIVAIKMVFDRAPFMAARAAAEARSSVAALQA